MGCISGCLGCINKTFLYVLNLLLFLIGLGVVIITSITLSKGSEWDALLGDGIFSLPIIVLIVGIFILLLGFFGCCGAKKENACMLYTYSSVLIILVIAQVAFGIWLLVNPNTVEDLVMDGFDATFDNYNNTNDHKFSETLDKIQQELECCGVHGPNFWVNATHMDHQSVPDSCCKDMQDDCGKDYFDHANPETESIYQDGCYEVIKDELLGLGLGISGLVLAGAGVQLAIVILTCCLINKSKKNSTGYA